MMASRDHVLILARVQGLFYLATGVWPMLHIGSFEAITGPKTDRWLVKTVGGLVAVTGLGLAVAGRRGRVAPECALIAGGEAAALAAIDVVYVAKRRIAPIYLLDAAVELPLALAWAVAWSRGALADANER